MTPNPSSDFSALQIIGFVIPVICTVITTILAWVMLNKSVKAEVTFTGTPVDRKECLAMMAQHREEHAGIHRKIEVLGAQIEPRLPEKLDKTDDKIDEIAADVAGSKKEAELTNQRIFQIDSKLDGLCRRPQR